MSAETIGSPHATPAEAQPAYKAFYGTSLVTLGGPEVHLASRWGWLKPQLPPLEGLRVLDVGCAEGLLTQKIAQSGPAFTVGVEKRNDRVERANELPEVGEGKLRFYHGKAHTLVHLAVEEPEVFGPKFDLVTCIGVLQHIKHADKAASVRGLCSQSRNMVLIEAPYARNPYHFLFRRRPLFSHVAAVMRAEGFELVRKDFHISLWRRKQ